jgi:hypothetical protein
MTDDDNLVRVRLSSNMGEFEGRYQDLSETGVRLRARRPTGLCEGDAVEVAIPAPGRKEPIQGRALVVRQDGDRELALRFEDLRADQKRLLVESLEQGFARARLARIRAPFAGIFGFMAERWTMIVAVAVALALAYAAMSWIVAPRGNYRSDTTIPWATRTF